MGLRNKRVDAEGAQYMAGSVCLQCLLYQSPPLSSWSDPT